ncbi:MAG TPA: tetratricopeptide repeat protein [Acetobacteraceae bacterium]|nr:tetratricopeptide repeat protein [Acetobacteraceae bacterium]
MPDIFDEVDEELRAERAQKLWERYGGLITGALLLVVGAVGGWQGWEWWQNRQTVQAATSFLEIQQATAAEGADLAAMAARFEALAGDAPAGYRTMALLRAAALRAEIGQREEARAVWDRISRDTGADPLYRDLATLLWALHGVDSADPATIEARLAPLTQPGGAWRASAREVQALLAIRRGQTEQARETLRALANDSTAPQGVRDRAGRLAAGLGG